VPPQQPNPRLDRVRFKLRTDGVPDEIRNPLRSGIHSRGYLPHVKREGASYFVTFRLADSLPKELFLRLLRERGARLQKLDSSSGNARETARPDTREQIERDHRRQLERYLDRGLGSCYLRRSNIGALTANALKYFDGRQYHLDEWVIMPNHIHLILWPLPNFTLSEILKSRKQHIATEANRILGRTGQPFWQRESFDHWIRDENEKARIRRYIRWNPVKATLCSTPEAWPWSSASRSAGCQPAVSQVANLPSV
jgi:REP element-mobilizing transposase RayT